VVVACALVTGWPSTKTQPTRPQRVGCMFSVVLHLIAATGRVRYASPQVLAILANAMQ